VKLLWIDGKTSGYVNINRLARATQADERAFLANLAPPSWCKKGALVKHDGRVGELTMDPDSDREVKIRWAGGSETSGYIRAALVSQATSAEQKAAVSWCKKGALVKHDGKVGEVMMDPDSDAEVKIRWAGGTDTSGYVRIARLHQATDAEQRAAVAWCKKGDFVKYQGKIGEATMDPDSDAEIKIKIRMAREVPLFTVGQAVEFKTYSGCTISALSGEEVCSVNIPGVGVENNVPLASVHMHASDVTIRVTGCDDPDCNGDYKRAGTRNGRACFDRSTKGSGALYFDGSHWKICQSGRGPDESGWNYSQLPLPESDNVQLPPLGSWASDRATSEMHVDYSAVCLRNRTSAVKEEFVETGYVRAVRTLPATQVELDAWHVACGLPGPEDDDSLTRESSLSRASSVEELSRRRAVRRETAAEAQRLEQLERDLNWTQHQIAEFDKVLEDKSRVVLYVDDEVNLESNTILQTIWRATDAAGVHVAKVTSTAEACAFLEAYPSLLKRSSSGFRIISDMVRVETDGTRNVQAGLELAYILQTRFCYMGPLVIYTGYSPAADMVTSIGLVAVTMNVSNAADFASFRWGHYAEELFLTDYICRSCMATHIQSCVACADGSTRAAAGRCSKHRGQLLSSPLCSSKKHAENPEVIIVTIQRPKADDWCKAAVLFRQVEATFMAFTAAADGGASYLLVDEVSVFFHPQLEAQFKAEMGKLDSARSFSIGDDQHNRDGFEGFFKHLRSHGLTHYADAAPANAQGSAPLLAWHGTSVRNVMSIIKDGIDMQVLGRRGGWHGTGFYTTTYPRYAEKYLRMSEMRVGHWGDSGPQLLMLNWILPGKPYPVLSKRGGADGHTVVENQKSAPDGYDSNYALTKGYHADPRFKEHPEQSDGDEICTFKAERVLPRFHVKYKPHELTVALRTAVTATTETLLSAAEREARACAREGRSTDHWCVKRAIAKQTSTGKVGEVTMDPDSDKEVRLRWSGGDDESGYIGVGSLEPASDREQREAVLSWCREGTHVSFEDRTGRVVSSVDSDAEAMVRWDDDRSISDYIRAVRLTPLGDEALRRQQEREQRIHMQAAMLRAEREQVHAEHEAMQQRLQDIRARDVEAQIPSGLFVDGEELECTRASFGARSTRVKAELSRLDINGDPRPGLPSDDAKGKIAVVNRGEATFTQKALNAQKAGAIALIVVNTQPGDTVVMGGDDGADKVAIPVVMVRQNARRKLQVDGTHIASLSLEDGDHTGRLKPGDCVKLKAGWESCGDASEGPLEPGDTGVLVRDDESSKPYQVRADNSRTWWYRVEAIERATVAHTSTEVMELQARCAELEDRQHRLQAQEEEMLASVRVVSRRGAPHRRRRTPSMRAARSTPSTSPSLPEQVTHHYYPVGTRVVRGPDWCEKRSLQQHPCISVSLTSTFVPSLSWKIIAFCIGNLNKGRVLPTGSGAIRMAAVVGSALSWSTKEIAGRKLPGIMTAARTAITTAWVALLT
jgi:hypothetical protein